MPGTSLADLGAQENTPFVLGHAQYMKAGHARRLAPKAENLVARKEKKFNKSKALSILAAKIGRAVYWMLRRKQAFDVKKCFGK